MCGCVQISPGGYGGYDPVADADSQLRQFQAVHEGDRTPLEVVGPLDHP